VIVKQKAEMDIKREPSSFRDPSGFVFFHQGSIYRQVNISYHRQYRHLMDSGLYRILVAKGWLLPYQEVDRLTDDPDAYRVIQPEWVKFLTYPYEWSFSQLKAAALLTLNIHKLALEYDMILKDASAYNIQFIHTQPVLIDSLSFDFYQEGSPWIAYGQFCRHFLIPLVLMSELDIRLAQELKNHLDGIPIDLASHLLKHKHSLFINQHIHWHALAIRKYQAKPARPGRLAKIHINKAHVVAMVDAMISAISSMKLKIKKTRWSDYYDQTNYSQASIEQKEKLVAEYVSQIKPKLLWDLGANNGRFSRIAVNSGAGLVISFDNDALSVEMNYKLLQSQPMPILPVLMDLTNPSPAIGFANQERKSIDQRNRPDCILALAILHHLAIANNLPFDRIMTWLADLTTYLIIEFIPKEDSQVQQLLANREDIFEHYHQESFERSLTAAFDILDSSPILQTKRSMYFCRKRQ